MQAPLFIGNEIYRHSSLGGKHPLSIPRVSTVMDLARSLGWLAPDRYRESRLATPEQLARFHREDYIAAVRQAERTLTIGTEDSQRYNLGRGGNPVYATMFRRPATGVGGSLIAADHLLRQGRGIVYSPGGGTHHGRPAQASGFCYFNDPVLAILAMLDGGLGRIAYVDLDVHHGDGVADAFGNDPRVLVISVHEAGRWPHSGRVEEEGAGNLFNYPVPPGMVDDEMDALIEGAIGPLVENFKPDAMVIQCGADALADDPLAKQTLSNGALWRAVAALRDLAPRLLVLGGGGYNPWSVARCWTGIWAALNGLEIPDRLPADAESLLRSLNWNHRIGRDPPVHWFTTLVDKARHGPVRDEVRTLLRRTRERMSWC